MKGKDFVLIAVTVLLSSLISAADETRLLREPTVSADHVAFVYANDIWLAPRGGGEAQRLTTHIGQESNPYFSPDGKWIAFTGQYDGNTDVFIVPTAGGEPKRLTYHPSPDTVRGWTPDGARVLFASGRDTAPVPFNRLWTISVEGGMPEPLPMPMANKGAFSPDGKRMAYVRVPEAFFAWRLYRGGRTTAVWLLDLADHSLEKIPRENSNDTDPMWIGDRVYFISDRDLNMNLYSYDAAGKELKQLTSFRDFDIRSASAGGGVVVFEQAGYLHIFDPGTGEAKKISVEVKADLPWKRPHFAKVGDGIRNGDISPTGVRAVFEARGDIFTVPVEKGDYRNLTASTAANDRYPAWSPDGRWIAWFSDASGEYELMLIDQKGENAPRNISIEEKPTFYFSPAWSPDSTKIAFTDLHLNIWYLDIESGKATKIDKDNYDHPERTMVPVWSPDSKWIAYAKRLDNMLHAIFVYSIEEGRAHQLTDGLSDALSPAFDRGGKYLYFLASTNYALNTGWLDMTSYERPVRRGVYLIVLAADVPSPLLPESDEEKIKEEKPAEEGGKAEEEKKEKEELVVRIDLEGIDQRIVDIDMPQRDYTDLRAGEEGVFFLGERLENQPGYTLQRYNLKDRKAEEYISGINGYSLSADGKKLLYFARGSFGVVDSKGKPKVGDGKLNTAALQMRVDPPTEWRQIYSEAWRINRDFFYDPAMHGADWPAVYKKYEPFLDHVGHRTDLSYILSMMIGEIVCGHSSARGGDVPDVGSVTVGLLGADYERGEGFYRFKKIYKGENWNPGLRAPLTAPGLDVREGDYLLEVNGSELRETMNVYSLFQDTAGKQIFIRVNDKPTLEGSRLVTVVPLASEYTLRTREWMEANRRRVDEMSGGKLAYVYLPNTSTAGYTNFNRYYFAQQDKLGAVIDERFNGGGSAADYFVDLMDRPVLNYWATRAGKEFATPSAAIFGPKVMIINEYAGSGGDALPYYFRKRSIGPLVGETTWGGLVGHHGGIPLIDGGRISSPNLACFNTDGEWDVENKGVAPDIEVEMTPALVIQGGDPQLERAVQEALRLLEENPVKHPPRPASPAERSKGK